MTAAKRRVWLSWSSGKDSAWALHVLRRDPSIEVVELLTTVNAEYQRVTMHAVRTDLLRAQAEALGLPLREIPLPYPCSNAVYDKLMRDAIAVALAHDIQCMAFGDLFLEDIRRYREEQLTGTGITPIFPLFGSPTGALAHAMIDAGIRARLTCVDPRHLDSSFAGREFDHELLRNLPAGVDPCGERGEFHTFVYDGPMFRHPIRIKGGKTVEREGFLFADVMRAESI